MPPASTPSTRSFTRPSRYAAQSRRSFVLSAYGRVLGTLAVVVGLLPALVRLAPYHFELVFHEYMWYSANPYADPAAERAWLASLYPFEIGAPLHEQILDFAAGAVTSPIVAATLLVTTIVTLSLAR